MGTRSARVNLLHICSRPPRKTLDYGLVIEMLIPDDNLRQARAGPSPP